MMEEQKMWMFTKSMEYSPKGFLQLGQVLLHPYDPNSALLPAPTLPDSIVIHKSVIPRKELQGTPNSFKLWGKTTNSFPEESKEESAQISWNCKRFEDYHMAPDSQYIQTIVQDINVKGSFSRFAFRKKIFLVIALRVVCGAYLETGRQLTSDAEYPVLSHGESGPSPLPPYVVSTASEFVFAYKLYEISVRKKSIAVPLGAGEDFSKVPRRQHGDKLASARLAPSYKTQSAQQSGHYEAPFSDEGYVTFSDDESDDEDWSVIELEVVDTTAGRRRSDTALPISKDITVELDSMPIETKSTSVGPLFGMDSATASTSATISSFPDPFQDGYLEHHDVETVYSELTVVEIHTDEYVSLLATDLAEKLSQSGPDSGSMDGVVKSLPNHLKEFATRIGGEGKSQMYRDIMIFCRRHRLRITQIFQKLLDEMTEELESPFRADDSMSIQEMMKKWLTNFEGEDTDEENMGRAGIPDESDPNSPELDDVYIDPVALEYRDTILQSAAYQRLLASLRQEMVLETPDSLFVTALQHKVSSIHGKTVSRKRAPSPCDMIYRIQWDPIAFVKEQEYIQNPGEALENAVTLTGIGENIETRTCTDFLSRNWPFFGNEVMALIRTIVGDGKSPMREARLILQDGTTLNASIQDSSFTVDISGFSGTVVGVGELLAWITGALRPHPYLGLASCTPFVKNFVAEYKVGERTSMWCEVDYNLEEVTNIPGFPTGRCWRDLFRNPIIVKGFKIRRRPNDLAGMESSLNIMTSLVQTRRIAVFDNRLFIKGFCTMLVPTKLEEDLVMWHVLLNEDGSQIAYTDPRLNEIGIRRDMTDNLTFSDLEKARHVVGWCLTVKNHAGSPTANVKGSALEKPGPGYVFERITITGGKYITAAAAVALGIKDKPIRLTSVDGYGQQLRSIAAKNILFYDSGDRRGWLVDGASALLHLVRSSLAHDDSSGFPETREPLKEAETKLQGRKAAISILNNDENRNLRLYLNKQRNWQDVTIKPDGTPEVFEKQEITYFELQHRVDDIFHILNLIQTHQENKISSDGIGFKVRLSPRRQLEGFDFHDIARGKEPMWSRATNIKACGKGWVDLVRAIDAITLFGKGFGELMEMPQSSTEICAAWRQVPTGQDYLAVSTEALKNIILEEPPSSGPLHVVDDIYWHTPDKCFEPCHCVTSKPCDRVQVLLPTSFPGLWGQGYRSPQALPTDGAVIFGHSWKLPLRWKDRGDPTVGSPDEDDLDDVSNDSAIGLAGSSRTSQDRLSQGPQTGAVDADHQGVVGWRHSAVQRLKKIGSLRKFKPLGQGSSKSSS